MQAPPAESGTQAGKGAAIGAFVGVVLGTALGLAVAEFVLPGAGPVIVGGLLAGALGGAVTGGASGGILGALIGLTIPVEETRPCDQEFHSGRSLVTVHVGDRYEKAVAILRRVAERPDHHHPRHQTHDLASDSASADGAGSAFVPQP